MTVLESRVDDLARQGEHTRDLSVTSAREALTARGAHQQNIELLNALRRTQAEDSQTLREHSETLAQHSETLAQHTETLAQHTETLATHTRRLDTIDERLDRIQGTLGTLVVGVHTIETLLHRLTDGESPQ